MASRFEFQPLGSHHDRAAFSCGVGALDRYLQRQARQDMQRNIAAVFVLYDNVEQRIAGYYTLSASSVRLMDLPDEIVKRLPRYPSLPVVLLGRLAVDQDYRGQRLGELLLMNAFERVVTTTSDVAAMAIVVDAKDDVAASFYQRYDFQQLINQPLRFYLPMKKILEALGPATLE